ncbi:uncharacterized protein LOC144180552 [Haemaphysalis longicornis]
MTSRQYFPSFRLALAAVLLLWYLAVPSSAGVILTGVAPNYEPEQPTFMYTNFGVIFGTRDFMKQFQFHSATDDFNHRHKDLIGTSGRIRENVTPYQGDPKRATRYTAGVNHNEQNRKSAQDELQAWSSRVQAAHHVVPPAPGVVWIV